ncbi:MAG: hypothetical protein AAGM67_19880, partial [Bacteroidota bacterium]
FLKRRTKSIVARLADLLPKRRRRKLKGIRSVASVVSLFTMILATTQGKATWSVLFLLELFVWERAPYCQIAGLLKYAPVRVVV